MCPPSTPMSAAIFRSRWAARTSSAVLARTISSGCRATCWRTASIWSSARFTASGPVMLPGIQMEKKIAPRPPSFMRGMSMLPSLWRSPRSKLPSRNRWVVSSCVSTTIEEKCSFFARAEMSLARSDTESKATAEKHTAATRNARIMQAPSFHQRDAQRIYQESAEQPTQKSLLPCLAVHFGERFGKRNLLGAGFHAVLRIGAILNAAGSHQRLKPFARVHAAGGMHVEEAHLADDRRADEAIVVIHLRANFQAASAGNARGKLVGLLLHFRRHARALAEIIGAIDGNPGLHALQAVEHE